MAATRLYLTADPAAVSPAAQWVGWNDSTGMIRGALAATPAGTNTAVTVAETNAAADWDVALGQWISEPAIRPGTLSGAASLAVARSESSTSADLNVIYVFSVVSGDGTVTRGTAAWTSATEWPTTLTAATESVANLAGVGADDTIEVQAGDRLVLEYGYRTKNTVTTSFSGTARYGGTDSTDLAAGDTGANATARPAWVEFADEGVADLFADVGTPFMVDSLGADARLAVEVAFGADLTADSATWAWTDVTTDVRQSDRISMRVGRSDEASFAQPANCQLTLDNRAGAYSLGGQSSNWPNVRRGTPVRVRVDPDLGGWHTRFFGYADGWTPGWDITGRDAVVRLSASGVTRRLNQGVAPVVSSFRRAVTGGSTTDVVAYWPCEDGDGADELASGIEGHPALSFSAPPDLAANTRFACSQPLPTLGGSSFGGTVLNYTGTGTVQMRMLVDVPDAGFDADSQIMTAITSGTITHWVLVGNAAGSMRVEGYNSSGLIFTSTYVAFDMNGRAGQVSLQLVQDGADVDYTWQFLELGAPAAVQFAGTATNQTVGRAVGVSVGYQGVNAQLAVGHVIVQSATTSGSENIAELNAYAGDYATPASGRLSRLCTENDLYYEAFGDGSTLTADVDRMGPQGPDGLLTLLRDAQVADQGILVDGLNPGLLYLTRRATENAGTVVTLDASAGELAEFDPVDDDQATRNRVQATRAGGAAAVFTDTDGPMGVATIGAYDESLTVNAYRDNSMIQHAAWAVHQGTVADYRFPRLRLDLARNPSKAAGWLAVSPGNRIDVTNVADVRTQQPPRDVPLVVQGWSEQIDQFRWDVTANCAPFESWRIATAADTLGDTGDYVLHLDTAGSTLAAAAAAGATSLSVTTASGPIWTTVADDLPLVVDVGGIPVTVTAISGASSPQTFTVDGATVTKALAAGLGVSVWRPPAIAL